MKHTIITALLALVALAANAAVPDSIRQKLADFDTIVQVAEKDYAAFKFKVTDANRKEYEAFKKSLVKDIKKQKRTWQDAICAYVGWFGDFHFGVYGNDGITGNYYKYARKRIDYHTLMEAYDPKMVSGKVDDDTYLIRFPSCNGTHELAEKFALDYKNSGCPNLIIDIPEGVKHWHGAQRDSWFQHYTTHVATGGEQSNEWLEPVTDEVYDTLK